MAQAKTQRDERRDIPSTDQFGRQWHVVIELKTGDPCHLGPAQWSDPLHTPVGRTQDGSYIVTVPKSPFGHSLLGQVVVDFKAWADVQRREDQNWKLNLFNIAQDTYKGKFDPRELENDEYVMHLAGPRPWPPVAVLERVQRNKQNDPLVKQFLGLAPMSREGRHLLNRLTVEDFEALAAVGDSPTDVIPTEYPAFVKYMIEKKLAKTIGDAAQLWQQHKAALAEA